MLKASIENGDACSVFGLNIGEKLALLEDSVFLFYVVDSVDSAGIILEKLCDMGRSPVFLGDTVDPFSSEFETSHHIIETLTKINQREYDTVILTPEMLSARFPEPNTFESLVLKVGEELVVDKLSKTLVLYGYKRVDLVAEKGEFSIRGDVVDIYPLGGQPTRIMTGFDIIESIRYYNPITLLTTSEQSECVILSNKYCSITPSDLETIYNEKKIKKDDLYFELLEGNLNDHRLLAFDDKFSATIFDFVNDGVIAFDGAKNIYDRLEKHLNSYKERVLNSPLKKVLSNNLPTISQCLRFKNSFSLVAFHYINQNNRIFTPNKVFSIRTLPAVNYTNNWGVLELDVANFAKQGYTVILCAGSSEQSLKLQNYLSKIFPNILVNSRMSLCQVMAKYLKTGTLLFIVSME